MPYTYTTNAGKVTITGYLGSGGAVSIPGTMLVGGLSLPVTGIGQGAFYNCTNVTGVTIPSSVTCLGDYAFYACTRVTGVAIPNGVANIGNYAFDGCASLASVKIPNSVTNLGNYAFAFCASLASVNPPDCSVASAKTGSSLANLGDYAFACCSNLMAIYFTGNAPILGFDVFYSDPTALVCYVLPGTTGWDASGLPTALWYGRAYPAGRPPPQS